MQGHPMQHKDQEHRQKKRKKTGEKKEQNNNIPGHPMKSHPMHSPRSCGQQHRIISVQQRKPRRQVLTETNPMHKTLSHKNILPGEEKHRRKEQHPHGRINTLVEEKTPREGKTPHPMDVDNSSMGTPPEGCPLLTCFCHKESDARCNP